jgi:hypothetical protein
MSAFFLRRRKGLAPSKLKQAEKLKAVRKEDPYPISRNIRTNKRT